MAKKVLPKSSPKQIKIKATSIKMVAVAKIKPHPKNPNVHSPAQIDKLKEIIKFQGFRNPVVISNQSGFLNAGHGRYEAALQLGMSEIPAIFQDFENDAQEYASLVSDNEIARAAKLNLNAIKLDVKAFKIQLNLLGFEDESKLVDVKGHTRDYGSKNKELDTGDFGSDLDCKCPKCGFEFSSADKK